MDEATARRRLVEEFDVPRGTMDRLDRLVALVREGNRRQNLVSAATLDSIWARHILDSAQLLRHAPDAGRWVDLGSGAGFPGLVVAAIREREVVMVEQRKLRAEFLQSAVDALELGTRARVLCVRVERVKLPEVAVISARAFAPLARLFACAHHLAQKNTVWLLPKGRNAQSELEAARASWQGEFRLVPSWTDPDARIIVADRVWRTRSREAGR
jgi:16S rRNA (guanine527-N7)-methyltransferase